MTVQWSFVHMCRASFCFEYRIFTCH